jgi:hypothetical protein
MIELIEMSSQTHDVSLEYNHTYLSLILVFLHAFHIHRSETNSLGSRKRSGVWSMAVDN